MSTEIVARRNKRALFCTTHESTPRPATDLYEPVTKDELPDDARCAWCGSHLPK